MQFLREDVRYGLRLIGASPGFAAITVLTLALGIGANTAIFTILDALVLRSLPVRQPDRLVEGWVSTLSFFLFWPFVPDSQMWVPHPSRFSKGALSGSLP